MFSSVFCRYSDIQEEKELKEKLLNEAEDETVNGTEEDGIVNGTEEEKITEEKTLGNNKRLPLKKVNEFTIK